MITEQEIKDIVNEIAIKISYKPCDNKTRDIIINSFREKLDPSIIIKCDAENNTPEIIDLGQVYVRLEWFENYMPTIGGKFYYCDIVFGETISISEYRDRQIDKILNKFD